MQQLLICILTFLLVGYGSPALAQEPTDIRFADFLKRFPKPLATLDETLAAYGTYDKMDNKVRFATKEIDGSLTVIYTPLVEIFKTRASSGNKVQLAGLSKEEQTMQTSFQTGSKGISESNVMNVFKLMMDYNRPLIKSGKLSWTKIHATASPSAQKLFRGLVEVESQFNWESFTRQAKNYKPKFGESGNEQLKAVQKKFDDAFAKLPKKKVKIMEGLYNEVEDPEKAIALLQQYKTNSNQALEQDYTSRYKWWTTAYENLQATSLRLDEIAAQAALLSGSADRSILTAIVDLQGRTWEAWQRLSTVTQGMFIDVMVASVAKKQVEESIEIYRKYKEGSQ